MVAVREATTMSPAGHKIDRVLRKQDSEMTPVLYHLQWGSVLVVDAETIPNWIEDIKESFDPRSNLITTLQGALSDINSDSDLLELADKVLDRINSLENEDAALWAEMLSEDLSKFDD